MSLMIEDVDLETALHECYRLIGRINDLKKLRASQADATHYVHDGKANAAAFRASLDLSDALSRMRRRK